MAKIQPMKKTKQKTILFDLDGTLIDSTSAILEGFEVALKGTFVSFEPEKIKAMIGFPLDVMFANLGFSGEAINERINAYRAHYGRIYLAQTTLLPYAAQAIALGADFADLAVVTTKTSKFSVILLENLGVSHFFGAVIGRDDVREPKPAAEPILTALERLKKGKENAFMVGDTALDVRAAQNADISCVAVSCGYESAESLAKFNVEVKQNALKAVEFIKNQ